MPIDEDEKNNSTSSPAKQNSSTYYDTHAAAAGAISFLLRLTGRRRHVQQGPKDQQRPGVTAAAMLLSTSVAEQDSSTDHQIEHTITLRGVPTLDTNQQTTHHCQQYQQHHNHHQELSLNDEENRRRRSRISPSSLLSLSSTSIKNPRVEELQEENEKFDRVEVVNDEDNNNNINNNNQSIMREEILIRQFSRSNNDNYIVNNNENGSTTLEEKGSKLYCQRCCCSSIKNSDSNSNYNNSNKSRRKDNNRTMRIPPYLATLLIISYSLIGVADACSSRSTPKPRPPTPTPRPNITFHMYTCPPAYAEWYCLNGATCFTVKIVDSLLYNCLCSSGYIGQRCEFKDLDGSYLPSRQRVMLETASIAGAVTIAVFLAVITFISVYIHCKRKQKELRMSSGQDTVDSPYRDPELRPFCSRNRSHLMIIMSKNSDCSRPTAPPIEQTRLPTYNNYQLELVTAQQAQVATTHPTMTSVNELCENKRPSL